MALVKEEPYEEVDSLPLPLDLFLKKYSARLPQMVSVNESLYGICSGNFTEGQLLQIYFLKETSIVNLKMSQITYLVPTASSIKYSIIYNPQRNLTAAREGYKFATVGDMIKTKALPSVVSVGRTCSTSLVKGQILILKAVEILPKNVKKLKCYNVDTDKIMTLEENCKGHFTTQPFHTFLDISIILKHFQLPVTVMLHSEEEATQKWFKQELIGVIMDNYLMQSVIASFCPLDSKVDRDGCKHIMQKVPKELIEIISTVPIDVRIVSLSDEEMMQLKLNTDVLARSISPQYVKDIITNTFATVNPFQKEILKSISDEEWRKDVQCVSDTDYELLPFVDFVAKIDSNGEDIKSSTTPTAEIVVGSSPPPVPPRSSRNKKPSILKKLSSPTHNSRVFEDIIGSNVSPTRMMTYTPPMSAKTYNISPTLPETDQQYVPLSPILPPKVPNRLARSNSVGIPPNITSSYMEPIRDRSLSTIIDDGHQEAQQSELMKELEILRESNAQLVARLHGLENTLLSRSIGKFC